MANRESSDAALHSQSKRPSVSHLESDSQVSDHAHHQNGGHQHRPKTQKHVVGGATGVRLHARVPSSKALHKGHPATTSSTKLNRGHGSPPLDHASIGASHRRAVSELNLSRDPSSTNLKKNASHSSLKRNRSKGELGKKSKSSSSLVRRSTSNTSVHKQKSQHQVHFDLGDDDLDQEDEWIDASNSASPLASRRASAVNSGRSSANPPSSTENSRPQSPRDPSRTVEGEREPASGTSSVAHSLDQETIDHKKYLTSRLLQRTPSQGAPPMMSAETASVRLPSSRQHSPESRPGTPANVSQTQTGSSGKAQLTSRFVTTGSQSGSGPAGSSFLAAANRGGLTHAANGKVEAGQLQRPHSIGALAHRERQAHRSVKRTDTDIRGDDLNASDEEDDVDDLDAGENDENVGLVGVGRNRNNGGYSVRRMDMNRTQQKLNLQRASSNLEPTHRHPGMGMGLAGVAVAAGPLVGGSGFESRDPRLGKLLELTGMEYLVVRRHQNPVARSLARLAQLPGMDKGRRIPKPGTASSAASTRGHSRSSSDYGSIRHSQSMVQTTTRRERGPPDPSVASLIGGAQAASARRPTTPRRGMSMTTAAKTNGAEADDAQGLSGASLVDRGEDAQTLALLRNLWDKNMDLSASQD